MKIPTLIFSIGLFIAYQAVSADISYRFDIETGDEGNFCQHRNHLTFKPTATCCANKVITPGINLTEHWAPCIGETQKKSLTQVEDIAFQSGFHFFKWDIYGCILKKSIAEKEEITLQDFADLVTTHYPDHIKTEINAEVEKQSIPATSFSEYEKLEKIRVTYYDIETAVCEGAANDAPYGTIENECYTWKEENHRAGICCKKAYPVDIRFETDENIKRKQKYVEKCQKDELHNELVKLGATDIMEIHIFEMCDVACKLHGASQIDIMRDIINNVNYWDFNVATALDKQKWLPDTVSSALIKEARIYVNSTYSIQNTTEAILNYEFADVIDVESHTFRPNYFTAFVQEPNETVTSDNFKLDFMRRKFHKKLIHIPILCSAYHDLAVLMEDFVFGNCYKDKN